MAVATRQQGNTTGLAVVYPLRRSFRFSYSRADWVWTHIKSIHRGARSDMAGLYAQKGRARHCHTMTWLLWFSQYKPTPNCNPIDQTKGKQQAQYTLGIDVACRVITPPYKLSHPPRPGEENEQHSVFDIHMGWPLYKNPTARPNSTMIINSQ